MSIRVLLCLIIIDFVRFISRREFNRRSDPRSEMWLIQTIGFTIVLMSAVYGEWPSPKGTKTETSTMKVSKSFDGGLERFVASKELGDGGQGEHQKPLFDLEDGATLSNVIIGTPAADGVHCLGSCTLHNVWWEDVGEDAATFKGTKADQIMTINGGGARKASDKVFQHNGPGTMIIKNFEVDDFGKLYRSCGNCKTQYARHVVLEGITAHAPGKTLAGINTNLGDTAKFSHITIIGDKSHKIDICEQFHGVTSGEPKLVGKGPDPSHCVYSTSDITYK